MGRTNNGFSRVTSLGPKEMNAFMEDIFMTVESKALVPENVQKSFADLGLYPWNPDTTGELCRKHCHHPTLLNATSLLRKLGRIISNNSAEQKAKQTLLTELEKCVWYLIQEKKNLNVMYATEKLRALRTVKAYQSMVFPKEVTRVFKCNHQRNSQELCRLLADHVDESGMKNAVFQKESIYFSPETKYMQTSFISLSQSL